MAPNTTGLKPGGNKRNGALNKVTAEVKLAASRMVELRRIGAR